jgi:hypothetical protein
MSVKSHSEAGGLSAAIPVTLAEPVNYQDGSVVSRMLMKRNGGTVTLFAFEKG